VTGALEVGPKPEIRAASASEAHLGLPAGDHWSAARDGNEYILIEGGVKGQSGFFTRDESGAVVGVDLAGRIAARVRDALVSSAVDLASDSGPGLHAFEPPASPSIAEQSAVDRPQGPVHSETAS
jgi:hypothetical protein